MPENRTELHSSPVNIKETNVTLVIKLGTSFKKLDLCRISTRF